ncbi:phage tail assembly protein [Gluconacetobacter azotocaptans]|uniref:phage tail assembly protein n=1 Tax=Gluconacetobacter azotocaptans TaxID=142834 RepID=UPI0030B846CD
MNGPTDDEVMAAMSAPDERMEPEAEAGVFVPDEPVILKKGGTFTELRLREPTVFETLYAAKVIGRRATQESIYDSQIDLVARVSKWPVVAVHMLGARMLDEAVDFLSRFEQEARRPADADPDLSPSLTLQFLPPIEAVNQTFPSMSLRPPTVGERRPYKAAETRGTAEAFLQAEIDLVRAVSEWPPAAVLKMPISQFARASDYLTGFFTPGPGTGSSFLPS